MGAVFEGESPVESPHISGNDSDDDAQYIEELIQQDALPPEPKDLPTERATLPNVVVRMPNRLVTRTEQFTGRLPAPQLLLPADVNRKNVWIASSVGAFFADNPLALPSPQQNVNFWEPGYRLAWFTLYSETIQLPGYTGALWVINSPSIGVASNWNVTALAITE